MQNGEEALPFISPAGHGQLVKMLKDARQGLASGFENQ